MSSIIRRRRGLIWVIWKPSCSRRGLQHPTSSLSIWEVNHTILATPAAIAASFNPLTYIFRYPSTFGLVAKYLFRKLKIALVFSVHLLKLWGGWGRK